MARREDHVRTTPCKGPPTSTEEMLQMLDLYELRLAHPTRFERVTFAFGGQGRRISPRSPVCMVVRFP